MRIRLLLTAAVAASFVGAGAAPAGASCYPEKPQTCHTCHVTGISISDDGVELEWQC